MALWRALQQVKDATLAKPNDIEGNHPEKHWERFEGFKASHLKTSRTWAIKESLRDLWATHSRLEPVIRAARTFHSHQYF